MSTRRGGGHWLCGLAAGALLVLAGLTVVARGQVVADRYALADCRREHAANQRRLRSLDADFTELFAGQIAPPAETVPTP